MTVKLMNQGKSTIDGKFTPGSVGLFDNKTAKKLLKLYPGKVVDLDNLTIDYDQSSVKDFSASSSASGEPKKAAKGKPGPKPKKTKDESEEDATDEELADALEEEA